jgi:hypothetical protein
MVVQHIVWNLAIQVQPLVMDVVDCPEDIVIHNFDPASPVQS